MSPRLRSGGSEEPVSRTIISVNRKVATRATHRGREGEHFATTADVFKQFLEADGSTSLRSRPAVSPALMRLIDVCSVAGGGGGGGPRNSARRLCRTRVGRGSVRYVSAMGRDRFSFAIGARANDPHGGSSGLIERNIFTIRLACVTGGPAQTAEKPGFSGRVPARERATLPLHRRHIARGVKA